MRTHSDLKPFNCDFVNPKGEACKYASKFKSDLNLHKRTHTGEKRFECGFPDCEYKASQRGNLIRHLKSHGADAVEKYAPPKTRKSAAKKQEIKSDTLSVETAAMRGTAGSKVAI